MRIAFLLRKFPAISETFVLNQVISLIDRGHDVDIYAIYQGEGTNHQAYQTYRLFEHTVYAPNVSFSPVKRVFALFPLLFNNFRYWSKLLPGLNIFRFKRQARSLYLVYLGAIFAQNPKHYDIIHCHFGLMGLIGCDLRQLNFLSGKLVTSFHGMDLNTYPRQHGLGVYQRLFCQGELFTTNSQFSATKLQALGCPSERIAMLPMGVDISKFAYCAPSLKNQYNIVNILSVGRLVECKGLEYGIRAIATLKVKYPHLHYRIIGEGPLYEELQSLILALRAGDYIQLLGSQSQDSVQAYYRESHILVFPSVVDSMGAEEGQGLVLQEAQASGLPVIATNIGGISDGVIDGVSGFLVEPRSSDALAERLMDLLEHPNRWDQMACKGREFIEQNYDSNVLTTRLENLYSKIYGHR